MDADGLYGINHAAKLLRISRDGKKALGENKLYELLRTRTAVAMRMPGF